jgi:hypothetical protein
LRLLEPDYPPTAQLNLAYYLGPNLLYHLACANNSWERWLRLARIATWPAPPGYPTPLQQVAVILDDSYGGPRYHPGTQQFIFPPGDAAAIREPGFDGDVIAHEYAHAVMHFLAAPLFVANYWNDTACAAFDEGLAFYWACAQFGNPDWGVFAYSSSWRARRNLAQAPALWWDIDWNGDEDAPHAVGMWWAGVLWQLHLKFGAAELRAALLKLLHGLATVQPDRIENGSPRERMRAVFRVIAANLVMQLPQSLRPTANAILTAALG